MNGIAQQHRRALDVTRATVASVGAEQWTAPTPNEGWDVRALVNHIVSGNLWAVELATGSTIDEVGDRLDGDVLGDDPLGAYDASAEAAAAAFEAPGALDAACAVSYGPVPGSVYAGHRFIDVLIHGWDLAAGTGQDRTLDPGLIGAAEEVLAPQLGMLQASGMFGTPLDVPDDAGPQTKLPAKLARQ